MTEETGNTGFRTRLMHAGRDPAAYHGAVNTPPFPSSTILSPDVETYLAQDRYARLGTETSRAAEEMAAMIEGGDEAVAFPSGLSAISATLLSVLDAGDRVLVAHNIYGPARDFCERVLGRLGVTVAYFDPMALDGLAELLQVPARAVYFEVPGSHGFEVCDVPAIAALARAGGAVSILDNTWSAGVFFRPLTRGVDLSIQSATKYWGGHADLMLGFAIGGRPAIGRVRETAVALGSCVSPEVCFLALRGMRTLPFRLAAHEASALAVARWLEDRPSVERVLHPALPSCPGHDIWRRDFTGSAGVFGVALSAALRPYAADFANALRLFSIGDSWGGYESLIVPSERALAARPGPPVASGPVFRLQVGLEDPDDLIADLRRALDGIEKKKLG